MNGSDLLIHIGYHKTGTTLLQRRVFSAEESGFSQIGKVSDLETMLVRSANFSFDYRHVQRLAKPEIDSAVEASSVPVLSHERFSGFPHRGGYDSKLVADRLQETFPNAKIFIVIREQTSMTLSLYKTYIRMGGVAKLQDYLPASRDSGALLFRFDYLEYDKLIAYYQSLFGRERVAVFPYELLDARPHKFLKQLKDFAGADSSKKIRMPKVNTSPSVLTLRIMRQVNKLVVRTVHNPAPLLPVHVHNLTVRKWLMQLDTRLPKQLRPAGEASWRDYVTDRVGDRFRESNIRTAEIAHLDLKQYGYSC